MRPAITIIIAFASSVLASPVHAGPSLDRAVKPPRVARAMAQRGAAVRAQFKRAGAAWPTKGIFLRAFKHEAVLEVWAAPRKGTRWVLVMRHGICAASGVLGPKRREGDGQVPEGFYHIDRFNPWSRYHLSLGLNYPNRVDLKHKAPHVPAGGDIFIHGDCVTIGCLPMTDAVIRDVYLAAVFARDRGQATIPVHIFPCRLSTKRCVAVTRRAARREPRLSTFWKQLEQGYRAFTLTGVPPRVVDDRAGRYVLRR